MPPFLVSVIIPTHNRIDKLLRLLDSLDESSLDPMSRQTIVVADNCDDGTLEVLRRRDEGIIVREMPKAGKGRMLGCGAARQFGLQFATAPYICFVDDDNIVGPDMIEKLINALASDFSIGAAGPIMTRWPETSVVWCAGADIKGNGKVIYRTERDALSSVDDSRLLDACDFFPNAWCTRRSTLDVVPFDVASFPHNGTEVDWGLRLRAAGYQCRTVIDATTAHDVGYATNTTRIDRPELVRDQSRCRVMLRRRHRNRFGSLTKFWLIWFPISSAYYFVRFARSKRFLSLVGAYVEGTLDGLK